MEESEGLVNVEKLRDMLSILHTDLIRYNLLAPFIQDEAQQVDQDIVRWTFLIVIGRSEMQLKTVSLFCYPKTPLDVSSGFYKSS